MSNIVNSTNEHMKWHAFRRMRVKTQTILRLGLSSLAIFFLPLEDGVGKAHPLCRQLDVEN